MTEIREKLVMLLRETFEYTKGVCIDFEEAVTINADHLISNGVTVQEWISVEERLPTDFISVLGYMTDAGEFPPVRECYIVGNAFFFPSLRDVHPVSHWMPLPKPPKGE